MDTRSSKPSLKAAATGRNLSKTSMLDGDAVSGFQVHDAPATPPSRFKLAQSPPGRLALLLQGLDVTAKFRRFFSNRLSIFST
jgi:hypothetical protein